MSTSLLYHAFGIHGYQYVRTLYEKGAVIFKIRQEISRMRCPECNSRHLVRKGYVWRRFRTTPIGKKTVWILLAVQRVYCRACATLRQVPIGFADPRRTYTQAFERYALELSRHMTILDAAKHLNVSWDVIKEIQKRNLQKRFSRPCLKNLRQIAIDEITIGKGHRYLTVVLDLISGAVVFVGEGRGVKTLLPFFKRLRRFKCQIEAVAMDMSPAYISAVLEYLPDAKIVFDHFHVIKLFNDRISDFRRKLYHLAETQQEKEVLKGTRWLLLKNPDNLDEQRNERQRLQEALELNQPLALVYYMKEDLRRLWSFPHKKDAARFLQDWVNRAHASDIPMLKRFANTLSAHRIGILAYYDFPISTAPLEGKNNKIKTMKRQAYGFRDMEFFKLKILALHEQKYALAG
jgi:transposase